MLDAIRMHSRNSRLLASAAAATALVIIGQMAYADQWRELLRYSGPLALFCLGVYAALWSPYVECSPGAVKMQNVLSIITLPWPTIRGVDGRYGLTIDTAYGEYTAWSATRPRLRPGPTDPDGQRDAATEVRRVWNELQAAGHLDNPRLEPDTRVHRWRTGVIELAAAFSVWTVASLFLLG